MPEIDVDDLLRNTGAILEGHFKLASGRHSGTYIEKFRIMENPPATEVLCGMIADHTWNCPERGPMPPVLPRVPYHKLPWAVGRGAWGVGRWPKGERRRARGEEGPVQPAAHGDAATDAVVDNTLPALLSCGR